MAGSEVRREVSRDIPAEAETLWSMVTDVARMGDWSPENAGGEWLDGASAPAVGARFRGHNRRGRTKWSTTCEVTASQPGREFGFAVGGDKKPSTRWHYRFDPLPGGGTRVTESFELPKALGRFSQAVTRMTTGVTDRVADMEEGMRTTLERLEAAAGGVPRRPADDRD